GAVTAMNLDGGGSSTMVVRNKVINRPSDPGGPRHVSSALLVLNGPDPGEASFGGPSSTSGAATMAGPAASGSWRLAARDPGSTGGLVQALVARDLWAPGFRLTPALARMLRLYLRG